MTEFDEVGKLFHFSDDPSIEVFEPRPVLVPSERGPGMEWLNGPLVWAVHQDRQACYCFPRDCPRIVLWPTSDTTADDHQRWWGRSEAAMIAFIERDWLETVETSPLYRYELPDESFDPVEGHTWVAVSRQPVVPVGVEVLSDMPAELRRLGVELRVMNSLLPLRDAWETSLHASGFRLRYAKGWE